VNYVFYIYSIMESRHDSVVLKKDVENIVS